MKNRSARFVCCGMMLLVLTPPVAFAQSAVMARVRLHGDAAGYV